MKKRDEMKPFAAAIEKLEYEISECSKYHQGADYCPCAGYLSAIRVLEAAGRVDKRAIEFFLQETIQPWSHEISSVDLRALYATGERHVEDLLAALACRDKS